MSIPSYIEPLASFEQRIILPQNNDATITFTIIDPNNNFNPVNLTGATITFYRKSARFVPDTDPSAKSYSGTIVNATAGICSVTIPAADNSVSGVIWYHLDVVLNNARRTAQFGPLEIFAM